MPRVQRLVLVAVAALAAAPAGVGRAEGVAGPYVPGDEFNHLRPGERPMPGWNPFYYPDLYRPHPEPYIPPGTPYHDVWLDDHWYHPPITNEVIIGSSVVQPGPSTGTVIHTSPSVVSPATPITTSVVANALPYTGPGVTIRLEQQVGGAVNYLIDGKESATIQAGQQQALTAKGRFEIRFSRGTAPDGRSFGEAQYSLTEGSYFFTVTDKGWELLRDPAQPTPAAPQAQPASPSGIKTTPLAPKSAPQPGAAAKPASDL